MLENIKKKFPCVFFVIITCGFISFILAPFSKGASIDKDTWANVTTAVSIRSKRVKQCFIQGHIATYKAGFLRRSSYQNWKTELGPSAIPYPFDPNKVESFTWFNDYLQWRVDVRRNYPSVGGDFRQISFDGEKYRSYDEYYHVGEISAEEKEGIKPFLMSSDDLTTFVSDNIIGGGWADWLKNGWVSLKAIPIYQKNETINGIDTEKFVSQSIENGADKDIQIWFSMEKGVLVKATLKTVNITSHNGSMEVYDASDIKLLQNTYIPFHIKKELYSISNNNISWMLTNMVTISNAQINDPESVSAFEHPVRVTAAMEDKIENPGVFTVIGGNTVEAVKQVREGIPPPLEIPGIAADGTAPEVVAAQEKLEIKP